MKMKTDSPKCSSQNDVVIIFCWAQQSTSMKMSPPDHHFSPVQFDFSSDTKMPHSIVLLPSCFKNLNQSTFPRLPKSLFPKFESDPTQRSLLFATGRPAAAEQKRRLFLTHASFIEAPVLWAGKLCVYYALLKSGLAGSQSNPFISDLEVTDGEGGDMGFADWIKNLQGNPDKEASDKRKLVSKWHPTTKGTLRRNYRVPSKSEGRRLLRSIAALLSEDDHFVDAASRKGCQIRRESAHGESVCCNNVRALFDELPTPHLIVEITAFPAGSLTEKDYIKAEKLERVLRSGPNI